MKIDLNPDPKVNEQTLTKYKGYDSKSSSQYLPDSWLELNSSHSPVLWKNVKNLKVGL